MSRPSFSLHTDCNLKAAKVVDNAIIYGPLSVVKLEAGRIMNVQTGIRIKTCNMKGQVAITPADAFVDKVKFSKTLYSAKANAPLNIEVRNISKQFIRIEPTDHLFKFEYVETPKPAVKARAKKEEPTVVAEVVADVVAEVVTEVVTEVAEVATEVAEEPEAKPETVKPKRRGPQKKKRVSV